MRSLSWYAARLRTMSLQEMLHRGYRFASVKVRKWKGGQRRISDNAARLLERLPSPSKSLKISFFDVEFDFFESLSINWSCDYKSGKQAPVRFYADIDYADASAIGDVKYIWEINRHQFLAFWAREYSATHDPELATAVVRIIVHWISENPQFIGINWASSLEHALRILSWGIALELCGDAEAVKQSRELINDSVAQQARFIRTTLSVYSSANNHLMGELVGLLAAAWYFPAISHAQEYVEFAQRRIIAEAFRQNNPSGVNREQAIYYHHYVLEYQLTALALLRRMGREVPDEYVDLCRRMTQFLGAMTDDCGNPFEIGDRDDGTVTGLNQGTGVGVFESLLWSGWRVFGDDGFAAHAARICASRGAKPACDPRTVYWFGDKPFQHSGQRSAIVAEPDIKVLFSSPEYFISRYGDYSLCFRAGNFGYPAIAAHAHCDQLSICLKHGCDEILTDSGTYCYQDDERWRRYFRGTSAHNTVRVDGKDQAEYGGPFLWKSHANASPIVHEDRSGITFVKASHFGYRRLSGSTSHTRTILQAKAILSVHDDLRSALPKTYELFWNLGPEVAFQSLSDQRKLETPRGTVFSSSWSVYENQRKLLVLTIQSDTPFEAAIRTADDQSPAGYFSRRFGEKRGISQLCISATARGWKPTTTVVLSQELDDLKEECVALPAFLA